MKTIIWVLALVGGTSPGFAADLPARPIERAHFLPPPFVWTGFYIGGNAGYHWDRDKSWTTANPVGWTQAGGAAIDALTPGSLSPAGFAGGGQIGFNYQVTYNFLIGLEGDANWLNSNSVTRSVTGFGGGLNPADVFSTSVRHSFLGTMRGRVGVVFDNWLFYATLGLAITDLRHSDSFGSFGNTVVATVNTSTTRAGWTAGGGLEYAFAQNWSAKVEYLYADFGNVERLIPSCVGCAAGSDITVRHGFIENVVRLGLNYRFGGPLTARY
jgi:outer membrane immunogenic protein